MTQEDKELLLKDLSARLPYGVKLHKTYKECDPLELRSLDMDNDKLVFYTYKGEVLTICDTDSIERFGQIKYKPYLFPMSSMTEEQKEEFNTKTFEILFGELVCKKNYEMEYGKLMAFELDFYNKHHLDWRGLIPKGLAIDATGLNIY